MDSKTFMIRELTTNEKLDGSNYDMWRRKIQFLLEECEVLEHLKTTMSAPLTRDEDDKDITHTDEYKANLVAYQDLVQKGP